MPRAIDSAKRKNHRKKILKRAKGFWGRRKSNYKAAKDAITKAMSHAYRDRKDRKGNFRRLWIIRINAACRQEGISYSKLIDGLNKASIVIDRKTLAWLATEDVAAFKAVVEKAKAALGS
ncbi:MAG: 50S ribosomal protein L20 [Spirochaetes bacterium]|nr:50S ribosomal protein L20 [Spirochaetota bacterium]